MAAERPDMRCIRDVLRLHFGLKKTVRTAGKSAGCGRTTAQNYINRAFKSNLTDWETIKQLSDDEIECLWGRFCV